MKKYLHWCRPPLTMQISPHKMLYQSVCYKKSKSLFFEAIKNGRILPSKACHFQFDNRFPFGIEMGDIRSCKKIKLQKLRIVSVLAFFKLLKNEKSFRKSFPPPFLAKHFNRTFNYLF